MSSIFTLEKLNKAYKKCQKGKKNTHNALAFEIEREKNLFLLMVDLQSRKYKISRYIYFISTYPTAREIFAADFRDRIVHHLIYDELYNIFDGDFIIDSYANRLNKGTHRAVGKLREFIKEVKKESRDGWYLKLDIQSFFRSIDKDILFKILEDKIKQHKISLEIEDIWQDEVLWLIKMIIYNDPTKNFIYKGKNSLKNLIPKSKSLFYSGGLGLPIGNLTSQFFANVYLNELDHFMKDELEIKNYVRYVDDFIMIDTSREKLKNYVLIVDIFLQGKLKLKLHKNKIILQPINHGVDFLGYYIKPTHTLVRNKVVKRFKKKLRERKNNEDGFFSLSDISMIKSYLGHFGHANSFRLVREFTK